MLLDFGDVPVGRPYPGVTTRTRNFAHMTVVLYEFEPGAIFPLHHHPEEQLVFVLSGFCRFSVGEDEIELKPGDAVVAAPDVPHGCVAGSDGVRFLNILSPRRESDRRIQVVTG